MTITPWFELPEDLQLLGFIMNNPETYQRFRESGIREDWLWTPLAQKMFTVFGRLWDVGIKISYPNVADELSKTHGRAYWVEFQKKGYPLTTNYDFHMNEFLQISARKQAKKVAEDLSKLGVDQLEVAKKATDMIEAVLAVAKPKAGIADISQEWSEEKENFLIGGNVGIPTHLKRLNDAMPRGFNLGGVHVLAARPGVGKTTMAINLAAFAAQSGRRTIYATTEMTSSEIYDRFVSLRSKVPFAKRPLDEIEKDMIMRADRLWRNAPLDIWHGWKNRWDLLKPMISAALTERPIPEFLVLDHLALMKYDDKQRDQYANLVELTGDIKRFAVEKKIAILLCSQMNRSSEKEQRAPNLSDLRGSGTIEQDADSVLFLDRANDQDIKMIVAKNRHGKSGMLIPLIADYSISLMKGDQF